MFSTTTPAHGFVRFVNMSALLCSLLHLPIGSFILLPTGRQMGSIATDVFQPSSWECFEGHSCIKLTSGQDDSCFSDNRQPCKESQRQPLWGSGLIRTHCVSTQSSTWIQCYYCKQLISSSPPAWPWFGHMHWIHKSPDGWTDPPPNVDTDVLG